MTTRHSTARRAVPSFGALGLMLAAALLPACGGGDSSGPTNDQVPIFEFFFTATTTVANVTYQVQATFNPPKPTTPTGAFTSASIETNDGVNDVTYTATGTWSGCILAVDVVQAATPLAPHYTGRFSGKDTIVLTPVAPSSMPVLTLARSNPEPTPFGC